MGPAVPYADLPGGSTRCLCREKARLPWMRYGKEYVDFGAGIGANALGYCDDGWVAAVSAQAARLQHCSNLYYNDAQAGLVRELCAGDRLFTRLSLQLGGGGQRVRHQDRPQIQL